MPRDRNAAKNATNKRTQRRAAGRRQALTRRILWSLTATVAVGVVGFLLFQSAQKGASVSGRAAAGAKAPEIKVTDFDGNNFQLSDYEGQPVVLNFWASWCPNCAAEMPAFEKVHQDLADQVAFLGIDQRDDRGGANDLAHATGVSYRLAEDPNGVVFDAFGGTGMPTTVFIDADGTVANIITGQVDEMQLRQLIAQSFNLDLDG